MSDEQDKAKLHTEINPHGSLKFYCASENWKPLYIAVTLSNQT
jgi:hypothetical protein